jgi:lysine-specific demethylase/histidyl-hydroxylase NO66
LYRLTGLDQQVFAERFWGRELHLARAADGDGFVDLFSLTAADELLSSRGLRTPFLRMVRDGTTIPNARFTSGGGVGATIDDQVHDGKVRELFSAGATVVLQGLHRTWRPIGDFVRELAAEIGHPAQANCYVTPPQNQGFDDHYDVHDVFVVQVHGHKTWSVHTPVFLHPLRDQPWEKRRDDVRQAAAEEAQSVITLNPGDCLYLPRGFVHSARALGGVSAHLTLGIHPWTSHDIGRSLLEAALAGLAGIEGMRASLPLGTTVGDIDSVESVRAALQTVLAEVPAEQIRAALAEKVRSSMRAAPVSVFDPLPAEKV